MKSQFLTYNGKRHELPMTADALDLGQYQRLVKAFRLAQEQGREFRTEDGISAVTGLPISAVMASDGNATYFIDTLNNIAPHLTAWLTAKPEKRVSIGGVGYDLKDWQLHSLGQRIMWHSAMDKGANPMERANEFIAILLGPQRYGKDWADNVELFANELLHYPAHQLVPICAFFLSNRLSTKSIGLGRLFSRIIRNGKRLEARIWESLGL